MGIIEIAVSMADGLLSLFMLRGAPFFIQPREDGE